MKLLTQKIKSQLPPLYSSEKQQDPMIWCKFFTPDAQWTWYVMEYDGDDTFFGLVHGFERELGYFSLSELLSVRGAMGLPIERDKCFRPCRLSEIKE